MTHKYRILAVVIFLGLTLGRANAIPVSYSGYTVISPQTVTLSGDAVGGGRSEQAAAGEIQLKQIGGTSLSIYTFCVDVSQWLQSSGVFSAGTYLTGAFGNQVNALISHVLPTLSQQSNASAALQVAIWQSEYNTLLQVTGNDAVTQLASTYMAQVASGNWRADPTMNVAFLDGGTTTQSQAYLRPIPEPATWALVAVALLGVAAAMIRHSGLFSRRRSI